MFALAQITPIFYSQSVRISLDKGWIAPILWEEVVQSGWQ